VNRFLVLLVILCATARPGPIANAQEQLPQTPAEDRALARAIFKEIIEINTTDTPQGNVTTADRARAG
jgi:hypothetical protein